MHQVASRLWYCLSVVPMVMGVIACGGDWTGTEETDETNQQNDESRPADCADDEYWHPIRKTCLVETEGSNAGDCEAGEYADPAREECVSRCGLNERWSEDRQRCVPTDCDEFEEWDEARGDCAPLRECGPGEIAGVSCGLDGEALPGAEVTVEGVDCQGLEFSETTTVDEDGAYQLYDIPAGTHELTVSSGSWQGTGEVEVRNGEVTDLTGPADRVCVGTEGVEIAIIGGTWDDIGAILGDLGIDYDYFTTQGNSSELDDLLGDLDAVGEYDIIFVECGARWSTAFDTDDELVANVLRRFVNEGNSLYASDRAADWIRTPLPEAMEFNDENAGASDQTVTADVLSDEMQDLLGATTADIHFGSPGWTIADDGGNSSEVHFQADVEAYERTVEEAALMTTYHDPLGEGRALFTSFHNIDEPTDEMEEILEFMIFQL